VLTALDDGALLAEKTGQSPAVVVALHGWGRSGSDFAQIVSGLDAVAIHLPGFGVTPEPATAWGSEEYADAVARAIAGRALAGSSPAGSSPVVVVGHSFGGRVAVRLAAKYPELVSGLVLTGVPLVRLVAAPKPPLTFRVIRSLARAGIIPHAVLEKQRHKRGSADYRAARGVMRDVLVRVIGEDYRDDLARVIAPVRMVWGANDTAAPADAGAAAAALIAGATFHTVAGAGHLLEGSLEKAVRDELHTLVSELNPAVDSAVDPDLKDS
jgi:pimeloyl-ACP methyl ester carboxylesterase